MKILFKYLLKNFFGPFFFSLALLTLIILVSELFEKLDVFLSSKAGPALIIKYLAAFLPVSFFEILPIGTLLAVLFSISAFVQKGEYTAAKSAGVNPYILFIPVFAAGFAVSVAAWLGNDLLLPKAVYNSNKIYYKEIRKNPNYGNLSWDNLKISGHDNKMFDIKHFDMTANTFSRVIIDFYSDEEAIVKQIDSELMIWDEATAQWILKNGVIRDLGGDGGGIISESKFAEKRFDFPERPKDFILQERSPEEMSYEELRKTIKKLKRIGMPFKKEVVALNMKISYPMANLIIVFIGLPIALMVKKSNKMLNFAFALGISFIYWGLISLGRSMGESGLVNPFISAWLANIVFGVSGLALFIRTRK